MTLSFWSLVGLIAGSGAGLCLLALHQALVYPVLSQRFEAGKVTGEQRLNPRTVTSGVRVVTLLLLPFLGLVLGNAVFGQQ